MDGTVLCPGLNEKERPAGYQHVSALIIALCSNLLSPDYRLHIPAICFLQNDRLESGAMRHRSPFSSEFASSGLLITVTGNQSKIDSQSFRGVFRRQYTQGHRVRLLAMSI